MLRTLIAKILLWYSPFLFAQNESGDLLLHVDSRYGDLDYTYFQYHGVRFEWYASDYVSLNYKLGIGKRHYDDKWHLKAPVGGAVGLPLFGLGLVSAIAPEEETVCGGYDASGNLNQDGEYDEWGNDVGCQTTKHYGPGIFGIFGIALAIIPNDITINIPLGEHFKLSPYVDFGSFHVSSRPDSGTDAIYLNYNWGFGSRFIFRNDKGLELGGFYEWGGIQKVTKSHFFGLSLGYNFSYL